MTPCIPFHSSHVSAVFNQASSVAKGSSSSGSSQGSSSQFVCDDALIAGISEGASKTELEIGATGFIDDREAFEVFCWTYEVRCLFGADGLALAGDGDWKGF